MRVRRPGLRRVLIAAAFLLVLPACSGDESDVATSTTKPVPATSTTAVVGTGPTSGPVVVANTTSTTGPAAPAVGIGETVLVVADDGLYQVDPDGDVELLVAEPVAYAVDDTQGGLLFQGDRGRRWDEADSRSTTVWWIPRGRSRPQELLVPTPGTDHSLSLHDAYATDDGFAVLYTRHEGSTPDVDMIDRLRRFELPAREMTELHSQGAFERGFGEVSSSGELIAGVWYQHVGSGCFIYDLDGRPTDLVPPEASDPAADDYVKGCRLSPDGNLLSFVTEEYEDSQLTSTRLHFWDFAAEAETISLVVPGGAGTASDLDVSATSALATFTGEDGSQTLVFNLSSPETEPIVLPIAGRARFVDIAVDIAQLDSYSKPPDYVLADDGLGAVSFGDPADDAMARLTQHFGPPADDRLYEAPFDVPSGLDSRGPQACHVATTGNVCFEYIRFAWWEDQNLWVLFSDIAARPGAAPEGNDYWVQIPRSFQGYGYGGSESAPLYTDHGVTVGSTVEDLLALGPLVSFSWDACGGQAAFAISGGEQAIHGLLDDQDATSFEKAGVPHKGAKVLSLSAGQSGSC